MKIALICIYLNTTILQVVVSTKEPRSGCQNGKYKCLKRVLLFRSRRGLKKDPKKVPQDELSMFQERIDLNGHLFRRVPRPRRNIRSTTGTPKAIIVKVNGHNVYATDGGTQKENVKPTSKVLQGTQSPPLPSPPAPFPKSHNINLHINLTKPRNSVRKGPLRAIFVSPLSVPQPQPQPIVALVPQSVQAVQAQVQPPMVSQVVPVIASPSTTPTTEKSSGPSLKKILLAAALLKGISGSSEENSQGLPSLLSNLVGAGASPVSSNPPEGYPSLGYPQTATPQLGFPAQGTEANIANAGLINPAFRNQNMWYPAKANQNLGYPNGGNTNLGYPPGSQGGGNSNMGYSLGGNTNMGYPANGNVNMGYPVAGNPSIGYQGGGNANMRYPVGGNENMGYPAGYPGGGNVNMGYPGGGGGGVGNMLAPTVPNFLSGTAPPPVSNPNSRGPLSGNSVSISGQNTASAITPSNGAINALGQNGGNTAGASPEMPETNPMSSCWCGCEADCSHPCDLCSTSPTNTYSYYNNYNGNENIIGALQPTRKG